MIKERPVVDQQTKCDVILLKLFSSWLNEGLFLTVKCLKNI